MTADGNGVLGSPSARVLLDSDFDNDVRQGARFALCYYFAKNPLIGIEANYFFLAERQSSISFSCDGDPVLAQPFINDFYGGQVGAEAGAQFGPLMIDFRCKMALGQMQQTADVNGATDVLNPDGSMTFFRGDLYALRSNIGRRQRDELAFVPEVGLNVGVQLTRHLKLFVGYSFL